jgi:hypothetical protein
MKFDYILNRHPPKKLISKGDTLYHDRKYTILGDQTQLRGFGVYKRYKARFKFSMFPVDSIYKGPLAKPDFKTDPAARYYRTWIREICRTEGVNFAGHYTIAEWSYGCQACSDIAIVDRLNGKIYYTVIPFDTADGHRGSIFKANSNMLIINSSLLEDYKGYCLHDGYYELRYYEFKEGVFEQLE